MITRTTLAPLTDLIEKEFERAVGKHGLPEVFSPHECYAVLLEEVDEMWEAIKANDYGNARLEAIHVGAMAIRYLHMSAPKCNPTCQKPWVDIYHEE